MDKNQVDYNLIFHFFEARDEDFVKKFLHSLDCLGIKYECPFCPCKHISVYTSICYCTNYISLILKGIQLENLSLNRV